MNSTLLFFLLFSPPQHAPDRADAIIAEIALSGRAVAIESAHERLADPQREIAPGAPPLLSFRYFEGADRHRFGKLDLMLDDAGH